jgi:outer membrane protein assembly factor BamB
MGGQVLAIDWKKGVIVWSYRYSEANNQFLSSPAVADGKVILGGRDRRVHAISEQTGKPVWEFTTRSRVDSSPVIAGQTVWIGSSDGNLYALDLKTGQEQWKFTLGGPVVAQAAISGDPGDLHRPDRRSPCGRQRGAGEAGRTDADHRVAGGAAVPRGRRARSRLSTAAG